MGKSKDSKKSSHALVGKTLVALWARRKTAQDSPPASALSSNSLMLRNSQSMLNSQRLKTCMAYILLWYCTQEY